MHFSVLTTQSVKGGTLTSSGGATLKIYIYSFIPLKNSFLRPSSHSVSYVVSTELLMTGRSLLCASWFLPSITYFHDSIETIPLLGADVVSSQLSWPSPVNSPSLTDLSKCFGRTYRLAAEALHQ